MKRDQSNILKNFINKLSELDKANKSDPNHNIYNNYKINDNKNHHINNNKKNKDFINLYNNRQKIDDYIDENPTQNKNKNEGRIFIKNDNNIKTIHLQNDENNIKNCMRDLISKNNLQKNNKYTNPFAKLESSNQNNEGNSSNSCYSSSSSEIQNNEINSSYDVVNNQNREILEISKNSGTENNYNIRNNKESHININRDEGHEINYNDFEHINMKESNKIKYLIFGLLGSFGAFLFLWKNKKIRNYFISIYNNIDFVDISWIKNNLEQIKKVLNYNINSFIDVINELNDAWRLFGIALIVYLIWSLFKLAIKFVIKERKNKDINKENNIELMN